MQGDKIKNDLKRNIKSILATLGRIIPVSHAPLRILTYHSVGQHNHAMTVSPEQFRLQMEWLARHYPVVSLEQAVQGEKGVAITFDDGYRDNLIHAAPILQTLGLPATVFVVAGRLGGVLLPQDDPATGALLHPEDLTVLESLGISIGSHSLTHPHLALLNEEMQREEIEVSALVLQKILGHPITAFAYPFGSHRDYNTVTMQLVRECGYQYAVSNRYGPNHPCMDKWQLRRIWIDASDTLSSFKAKVSGFLDTLALLDTKAGLRMRAAINRRLLNNK